jgi:CheY-like chemotaxis protein/anti-sigma regulatory factor (Ser/Thr protein kinase)
MQSDSGNFAPESPKRALTVDASPEVNALVRSVLDPQGWNLVNVATNIAASTEIQSGPFDVIVTSEKTSVRDDLELLREIRSTHPHTRVIILASESTPADLVAAMREHAFSYFTQPFSADELSAMLQTAMDSPSWDDGIKVLSANPTWIRVFARCDIETADRLVHFLSEMAADLPEDERRAVGLAFHEILLNAIEHGGHFDPKQYVEISYLRSRRAVACRIKDPGSGFSLDEIPHAAVANNTFESPLGHLTHRDAQGLRSGGYGVLLARELVDELIYGEKGNEVLLIKYLDSVRGGTT